MSKSDFRMSCEMCVSMMNELGDHGPVSHTLATAGPNVTALPSAVLKAVEREPGAMHASGCPLLDSSFI